MIKGIKVRVYPNRQQRLLIEQTFGCCRYVYNKGIDLRKKAKEYGISYGYNKISKAFTQIKQEKAYEFLKEVDAVALQQSLRDLENAYTNFFEKHYRYPKYKTKRDHIQSYRTGYNKKNAYIKGKYIKIPKIGFIKTKQKIDENVDINHVIVKRTSSNKYFIILNINFTPETITNTQKTIGIDVGLKYFYIDSNGNKIENPKYLDKQIKKLSKAQRCLSNKHKGSNNWKKQCLKISKIYEKITNQRTDFLQKQSTILIKENQIICIEDLNIAGMLHNRSLAKSISDTSWGAFFTMLDYKAIWYNRTIIRVPRMYASSQICSSCGYKNIKLKNLDVRNWECPICHSKHDRDVNAAKNILNKGIEMNN